MAAKRTPVALVKSLNESASSSHFIIFQDGKGSYESFFGAYEPRPYVGDASDILDVALDEYANSAYGEDWREGGETPAEEVMQEQASIRSSITGASIIDAKTKSIIDMFYNGMDNGTLGNTAEETLEDVCHDMCHELAVDKLTF